MLEITLMFLVWAITPVIIPFVRRNIVNSNGDQENIHFEGVNDQEIHEHGDEPQTNPHFLWDQRTFVIELLILKTRRKVIQHGILKSITNLSA